MWEPFGGLFSACRAAIDTNRRAFGGEINPYYFNASLARFRQEPNVERFDKINFTNETEASRMAL